MIEGFNIFAVLVAAIAAFVLGGIWYSPILFGKIWQREAGITTMDKKSGHIIKVLVLTFLLTLIAALVFDLFLGEAPGFVFATVTGFAVGLCWVASSFGINYLFANRSLKLFLIDSAYHTLKFTLYGVVFGLWH